MFKMANAETHLFQYLDITVNSIENRRYVMLA